MNRTFINQEKTFVIINSSHFGDILLTSTLIQNIKNLYNKSKVIMVVTSENCIDFAKHIYGVDDALFFDRKGLHKGFCGMMHFAKNFPYKNIYAAIPVFSNDRLVLLCHILKSKYVLSSADKLISTLLMKSKYFIGKAFGNSVQEKIACVLKGITKEKICNYPIKLETSDVDTAKFEFMKNDDYIVLCPISSNIIKNIPCETVVNILRESNQKVVLLGAGTEAEKLSKEIRNYDFENLIDLTNKTTILECVEIIKKSLGVISCDTSFLHISCALNQRVVLITYTDEFNGYIPDSNLYRVKVLRSETNAKRILQELCQKFNNDKGLCNVKPISKLSVIIPTLQKDVSTLTNLVLTLTKDEIVDEILIIDNSLKGYHFDNEKVRVITPKENLFVNPSWNLGVQEAKNEYICLANDDIKIPENLCTKVIENMKNEYGIIGIDESAIINTRDEKKNEIIDINNIEPQIIERIKIEPTRFRCLWFAIIMFFKKENYVPIPEDLKIFFGDDWIFYQAKKLGKTNVNVCGAKIYHLGSMTSNSFRGFVSKEKKKYFDHIIPKYRQIFYCYETYTHKVWCILGLQISVRKRDKNEQ